MARDTICALASGHLPSAIALVRVSGPAVTSLCEKLIGGAPPPRRASLRRVRHPSTDATLDHAVAVYFDAPNTYTSEDILELSLHGGRAVVEDVLAALVSQTGVRLAEPGEFTRRGVENGRLDLLEAEGVADLIDAETTGQRDQALRQLSGHATSILERWRQNLLEATALVEVAVDFPDEEDAPDRTDVPVEQRIDVVLSEIDSEISDGERGQRVRDGFRVAIVGPPNVGKSTLLNAFAGREAAIVTNLPGTTRDIIEVRLQIGGHVVWFMDTAGLRESDDRIEAEGIRRGVAASESADIRLHLYCDTPPDIAASETDFVVRTKSDVLEPEYVSRETFTISAKSGEGMDDLLAELSSAIENRVGDHPPIITRIRHQQALRAASDALRAARHGLRTGAGAELVAEDIRSAARALDRMIGRFGVEDVLGEIFSSFCIGK